jgi:hypothetical protein
LEAEYRRLDADEEDIARRGSVERLSEEWELEEIPDDTLEGTGGGSASEVVKVCGVGNEVEEEVTCCEADASCCLFLPRISDGGPASAVDDGPAEEPGEK